MIDFPNSSAIWISPSKKYFLKFGDIRLHQKVIFTIPRRFTFLNFSVCLCMDITSYLDSYFDLFIAEITTDNLTILWNRFCAS